MGAQELVGVAAEPGGHAVDRLLAAHLLGKEVGGARHQLQRRGVEFDRGAVGDHHELLAGERDDVEADVLHALVPSGEVESSRPVPCARSCSSSTWRVLASSSSATSNCSPRRRSLTATTRRAASSLPRTTTKRMPAPSAYCSLRTSSRCCTWCSDFRP